MAETKPKTDATPAPADAPANRAGPEVVLVRLHSAGADDKFTIGGTDQEFVITPQGVEVPANRVEDLLEIAAYNGVALAIGPVEKDGAK